MGKHFKYHPPVASRSILGGIALLLHNRKTHLIRPRLNAQFMARLPGGELYFDAGLEVDTDGSVYAAQDGTGQSVTSLHYPNGDPVDADTVPYFVLPKNGFDTRHHIRIGDIAAVIWKNKLAFAVYADRGPEDHIGEGSLALHRALGHERIQNGQLINIGVTPPRDVITIVFPGSGNGTPQTPELIQAIGQGRFALLAAQIGDFPTLPPGIRYA